jgi:hypothetical protein
MQFFSLKMCVLLRNESSIEVYMVNNTTTCYFITAEVMPLWRWKHLAKLNAFKPQRNIRKRQSNAVIYHRHNAERQMRHDIITVYAKIQTRNIEQMFINYLIYKIYKYLNF